MVSTVWGVNSGHLPVSPGINADNRVVSLYADGQKRIISTDATTVGDALSRAGVTLAAGDLVEPSAATPVTAGFFNINVYRARPVTIVDAGKSYRLLSAYSSPRLLAEAAGLKTYPEDHYQSEVVTNFVNQHDVGIKVTVQRSLSFTVSADGTVKTYRAQPGTVAEALAAVGVKLGLQDTVNGSLSAMLVAGEVLRVTRVSEIVTTIQETLPATVQKVDDPTALVGQSTVKTPGSDGHETVTYRINYRDGVETSRAVVATANRVEPVTTVITVGTKVLYAGSVEYWRPMVVAAATQYGLDAAKMMRIMSCESSGSALASNGSHFGLFQYLSSTWRSAGGNDNSIFDGPTQIALTAKYMAAHGTGAWQCQ